LEIVASIEDDWIRQRIAHLFDCSVQARNASKAQTFREKTKCLVIISCIFFLTNEEADLKKMQEM